MKFVRPCVDGGGSQTLEQSGQAIHDALGNNALVTTNEPSLTNDAYFTGLLFLGEAISSLQFSTSSTLTKALFPNVTEIASLALINNTVLAEVTMDELATLTGGLQIYSNPGVTRLAFPKLTSFPDGSYGNFYSNGLTFADLSAVTSIGASVTVSLASNALTSMDLGALTSIGAGSTLSLAGNDLTDVDLSALATIGAGGVLNLDSNALTAVDFSHLSTFGTGSTFAVSNNLLTDLTFPVLSPSQVDVIFNANGNALTSASVTALLVKLDSVWASGGSISLAGGNEAPVKRITALTINAGGTGYTVGDPIVSDPSSLSASVTAVDGDGAITEVSVSSCAEMFTSAPPVFVTLTGGTGASIAVSAMSTYVIQSLEGKGCTVAVT